MLVPSLMGDGGLRTYLILSQNNHELRATGGFISGVGELTLEEGRLIGLRFDDSYAVDDLAVPHELAPTAFRQTLFGQLWLFRDTNWDPDFPTSARRALDVYARDRGVQADGVIALDLSALQVLVEALGPIQVAGSTEPVTGENILPVIQAQWAEPFAGVNQEGGEDWWLSRKSFIGQIANAVLRKLLALSPGSEQAGRGVSPVKLARSLNQALDEKHILIYLTDPRAEDMLRHKNWDGALVAPLSPSDNLLVVDSNVGFNKADANVARSIDYRVDLAGGEQPRAQVILNYWNHSRQPLGVCIQEARYGDTYADMMDRCYWDYVRVYVPAGGGLLKGPDLPLPPGSLLARSGDALAESPISPVLAEDGRSVWAAFFELAPGAERALAFEYTLPGEVLEHKSDGSLTYHLRVQKQPGTEAVPLRVEIALPPDAQDISATPAGFFSQQGTVLVAATDLMIDREFEVAFRREREGP